MIEEVVQGIKKLKDYRSEHHHDLNITLLDANIRKLEREINEPMSKDKGGKSAKKAPSADPKKALSDYQTGKTTVSKIDVPLKSKKR